MHFFEKSELGNDGFSAAYEVSLEHLNELDMQCLLEWKNLYEKHKVKYPLDMKKKQEIFLLIYYIHNCY